MSFGFPKRITAFLLAATLIAPYFILEQNLLGGTILRLLAPLWALIFFPEGGFALEFPIGSTIDYLPFWGMGLIIAGLTYFSQARNELTRLGYVILIFVLLLMQLGYFFFIGYLISGGPPIILTPLPVIALLAFLLTPLLSKPANSTRVPP